MPIIREAPAAFAPSATCHVMIKLSNIKVKHSAEANESKTTVENLLQDQQSQDQK